MNLDIKAIRDSFERVTPIAGQLATRFYSRLWDEHPEAKALFADVNMEKQKTLLVKSLAKIVDSLDQPEKLSSYLTQMGSRHLKYGTEAQHYTWVGAALLATFRDFLGETWTPYLENQWTEAYTLISETMLKGASEHSQSENRKDTFVSSKKDSGPRNDRIELTDFELPQEMRNLIRTKVRQKVRQLVRKEIDDALAQERREFEESDFETYARKVI